MTKIKMNETVVYVQPCNVEPVVIEIDGQRLPADIESDTIQYCVKYCFVIINIIFCLPIIICDLSYATTYKGCLSQTTNTMEISMYDYLLVNSIYCIISLLLFIIAITCIDLETTNIHNNSFYEMIGKINAIFNIVWTCIGAVIFWAYLNLTVEECSNSESVGNYLKISIIIKIIISFIQLINIYKG